MQSFTSRSSLDRAELLQAMIVCIDVLSFAAQPGAQPWLRGSARWRCLASRLQHEVHADTDADVQLGQGEEIARVGRMGPGRGKDPWERRVGEAPALGRGFQRPTVTASLPSAALLRELLTLFLSGRLQQCR